MRNKLSTPGYGTREEAEYAVRQLKITSKEYYGFKLKRRDNAFRVEYKSRNKSDYLTLKQLLDRMKY